MAQKDRRHRAGKVSLSEEKPLIPQKYETPALIILILVLLVAFFHEAFFQGKVFVSPDVISPMSFQGYLKQAKMEHVFPLWIPYVFSGMPSFASLMTMGTRWYDLTSYIFNDGIHYLSFILGNTDVGWAILCYFIFGIGIFLLLRRLQLSKFASFFAAVATIFMMYIIIWIMVGHGTKILTMTFFPYIFLFLLELQRKFRWSYFIGLILSVHLMLEGSHIQMIYYTLLTLGFFYFYNIVVSLFKRENVTGLVKNGLLLLAAGLIAFAMSSDKYMSILEYTKYSIRGSQPMVQSANSETQGGSGLGYDYATNWSFSPEEITTFFVPSFYGFGDFVYNGPLSNNQPVRVNTYFGQMPFTDAPEYMGVITLILAAIGFLKNRKNRFVQFSAATIIISILLSFGRTFPFFFNLMFYHFPLFNKFRAPSMILVLPQIFVPILSAYGIDFLTKARLSADKVFAKRMMTWGIAFVALLLLSLLMNGNIKDFYYGIINSSHKIAQQAYPILFDNMIGDLYIFLFICAVTFGIIYFYVGGKMKTAPAFGALFLVLIFDMWRVDAKPMQYSSQNTLKEQFAKPDYVSYIQQDTSLYRVLQLDNLQPITSNTLSYFDLQNAYGYSAAKLRNYQNMMDVAGIANPNILRLLGVKYIISNKPDSLLGQVVFKGSQLVIKNNNILPRAFFVDNYKVSSPLDILTSLRDGSFDPAKTVYFVDNPNLRFVAPDSGASVKVTDYEIQSMTLKVHATGNNFVVLSEVYYPKGWEAFIDGKPTKIYQSDYFLRGLDVPEGNHTITLEFHPATYYVGRDLSLGTNVLLLVGLIGIAGIPFATKKRGNKGGEETLNS